MIEPNDILVGDIVKVKVEEEDELYAEVHTNGGRHLLVRYFIKTTRFYKDAPVFRFEENTNVVEYTSLMEHYNEWTIGDFSVKHIKDTDLYVFETDICSDVSDSDIESSDESDGSIGDFIANEDTMAFPLDADEVDAQWNTWNPTTSGGRGFKRKVDEMEARYKHQNDNSIF